MSLIKSKLSKKKSSKKAEKKSTQGKKYPLRGKPVKLRNPFKGVATSDWEAIK